METDRKCKKPDNNVMLWHEEQFEVGTLDWPRTVSKTVRYLVKVHEKGSKYGIEGGKISKLWIEMGNEVIANYDRGWDIRPDKNSYIEQHVYRTILERYN